MYVVITGASRGIGLELTRQGLEKGHTILAVVRNVSNELSELKNKHTHLQICIADLTHQEALKNITESCKGFPQVDLLINNAGIYLQDENPEDFEKSFLVNSTMPYFLTLALKEKLKASHNPISAQITSMMGSIADNNSGGSHSYRASKAALNMLFKGVAIENKWLTVLQFHPGWVKTRMGGDGAPVMPETSAAGLWNLITSATRSQSGSFLDFQGRQISW